MKQSRVSKLCEGRTGFALNVGKLSLHYGYFYLGYGCPLGQCYCSSK